MKELKSRCQFYRWLLADKLFLGFTALLIAWRRFRGRAIDQHLLDDREDARAEVQDLKDALRSLEAEAA